VVDAVEHVVALAPALDEAGVRERPHVPASAGAARRSRCERAARRGRSPPAPAVARPTAPAGGAAARAVAHACSPGPARRPAAGGAPGARSALRSRSPSTPPKPAQMSCEPARVVEDQARQPRPAADGRGDVRDRAVPAEAELVRVLAERPRKPPVEGVQAEQRLEQRRGGHDDTAARGAWQVEADRHLVRFALARRSWPPRRRPRKVRAMRRALPPAAVDLLLPTRCWCTTTPTSTTSTWPTSPTGCSWTSPAGSSSWATRRHHHARAGPLRVRLLAALADHEREHHGDAGHHRASSATAGAHAARRSRREGPSLNRRSGKAFTGSVTWHVELSKGTYRHGVDGSKTTRTITVR
jgi:hypothetical protein